MTGGLVSAVEWGKKEGKWTCSLIYYDEVFNQIWLESGINLSFEIQPGQYCIGYTTLSSHIETSIALEPWKGILPCPSKTKLKRGYKCSLCYKADLIRHCLICDGTKCLAETYLQRNCQEATAYVYFATFGYNKVKAGVAHKTRIPLRWIEQGANLAKRIIIGNGMEVRKFENIIHDVPNILSGLKTEKKIDTLWKKHSMEEKNKLIKAEKEIKQLFPNFQFYQDTLHDLSKIYNLPLLDRRPIEIRVNKNLQISGKILGVKGSILLLSIGALPYFLNLKHLIGRKIELKEVNSVNMQTALNGF